MLNDKNTSLLNFKSATQFFEHYQQHLLYLDKLPAAVAIIRIDIDDNGDPCDFVFVYVNDALAELEGLPKERLLGSSFYDIFTAGDKKWLLHYWKTAYHGTKQEISDYSPEIDKHLSISCFQPMHGYCGCVLRDVTEQYTLEQELQKSRNRLNLVLQNSVDVIFNVDLEKRIIDTDHHTLWLHNRVPHIENIPQGILDEGLILESGIEVVEDILTKVKEKEITCTTEIMARMNVHENFEWYSMTLSSFLDTDNGKLYAVGFMKNINEVVLYREALKRKAEMDGLTGIYNVSTGKKLSKTKLFNRNAEEIWAMLLFDIDRFKQINDTYGHAAGDLVLRIFSSRLLRYFSPNDIVYRLGGDEFCVFMQVAEKRELESKLDELLFGNYQENPEINFEFSASCGIAISKNQTATYEKYYKVADEALYQVKAQNIGNYHIEHFF